MLKTAWEIPLSTDPLGKIMTRRGTSGMARRWRDFGTGIRAALKSARQYKKIALLFDYLTTGAAFSIGIRSRSSFNLVHQLSGFQRPGLCHAQAVRQPVLDTSSSPILIKPSRVPRSVLWEHYCRGRVARLWLAGVTSAALRGSG